MKILVLGAGGIGGYFGGRLVEAGADVTFLVRPARREQLQRDGLRITSPLGDATLNVRTVVAAETRPEYDVVLLTCKAYDLDSAIDAITPALHANSAVLPMLNGLSHLARLDQRFGAARVLGGTCMIDVMLAPDGVVQHRGTLQRIVFGERDRSRSPRIEAIDRQFSASRFDCELADDILQRLWDKIVMLSALAATTCLFRANIQEIMSAPGGREAAERALTTNLAIAAAEGHALTEEAAAFARARLTDASGPWSASLLRDLEGGGRIEGDHIVGWMLERARAHAIDDTVLSFAYTALKAYEARRDAGRLATR